MDTHPDLTLFQSRHDLRAIAPQLLRTARAMSAMDWICSPAYPANAKEPIRLQLMEQDTKALMRIASGPTDLMATWKARTFLMRDFERRVKLPLRTSEDVDAQEGALKEREDAIRNWCYGAQRVHEIVFLHALLFRDAPNGASDAEHLFCRYLFDPMIALSVVRRSASPNLPVYSERQRGATAQAVRGLTHAWTRVHYGLDLDDPASLLPLCRAMAHGQLAGDHFIAMRLGRRLRGHAQGDHHGLGWWMSNLPPQAFRHGRGAPPTPTTPDRQQKSGEQDNPC